MNSDSTNREDFKTNAPGKRFDSRLTREELGAPKLSHRSLTFLLAFMCMIPVTTILVLWQYLPDVHEGQLKAEVYAKGLPPKEYYSTEYYKRLEISDGALVLKNNSDVDWTHLNVQINGNYQIYDKETIPAHGQREYILGKFLNRTGARFQLQYNELDRVRVYARRPTKDRATFEHKFETYAEVKTNWWPVGILLGTFALLLGIASVTFSKLYAAAEAENRAKGLAGQSKGNPQFPV